MSGLGISILSEHTLTHGGSTGLAILRVKELPIESTWYLVRLRNRQLSLIAETFLDYLREGGGERPQLSA
jgi:DNA-binding transcriptional LysR family regulator